VIGSFDRPNLFFAATEVRDERERFQRVVALLRHIASPVGSAILYVPTRNRADGIAKVLRWRGFEAAPYHAGLPGPSRRALLGRFLDGRIRIMVATNAFGMGIDKPDVRLVAHLGVPARPEAYYQEAGRAGRDGHPAHCELFWTRQDLVLASLFAKGSSGGTPSSDAHRRAARLAFTTMCRYGRSRSCRRRTLLAYLGEAIEHCAGCDRCGVRG
jgi:ATP-dependent DNA helicase RecQ